MTDREIDLLEKISNRVLATGDKGWEILVAGARISSYVDMIQYAILGVVIYAYVKAFKRWKSTEDTSEGHDVCMVVGGICLALFTLLCFCCLNNTIVGLISPEYLALKKLIGSSCK